MPDPIHMITGDPVRGWTLHVDGQPLLRAPERAQLEVLLEADDPKPEGMA